MPLHDPAMEDVVVQMLKPRTPAEDQWEAITERDELRSRIPADLQPHYVYQIPCSGNTERRTLVSALQWRADRMSQNVRCYSRYTSGTLHFCITDSQARADAVLPERHH